MRFAYSSRWGPNTPHSQCFSGEQRAAARFIHICAKTKSWGTPAPLAYNPAKSAVALHKALLGGQMIPFRRFDIVLGDARHGDTTFIVTSIVHEAEVALRFGVARTGHEASAE